MEIIAERKRGLVPIYIFALILCLVLDIVMIVPISMSAASGGSAPWTVVLVVLLGIALDGACIWIIVGILRTPKIAIRHEGNKLYFADGSSCFVYEVMNVKYRRASARSIQYQWGKIYITVGDRTIVYKYIADVEEVHDRILRLMLKVRGTNNG